MAILSTGPIENRPVGGVRPTQQVTVKIDNNDSTNSSSVLLQGYHLNGTRTLYVLELFIVAPNQVITKDYFANFDAFEFVFTTSGPAEGSTEISVWGKSGSGQLIAAHRLVLDELSVSVGPGVQTVTSGPIFRDADTSFIQVSALNVSNDPQTVTVSILNWQNQCPPEEFPKFGFLCGEIVNEPENGNGDGVTIQNGVIFFPPVGFIPVLTPFTFTIPAGQLFSVQAYPGNPIIPPDPVYEVQVTLPTGPVLPVDPVLPIDPIRVNTWGIDGFGFIQEGNTVLHHQFTRFLPTDPI
ncbi:hypothetical protein [Desulfosporosinus nitroreducens]|uniref:Uncharacterized protein n=1 Tax=Desulfosporosinus nitroreducens TaxID=2018668 RepID=A0ABT8QXE1_9FIRM|nr:hypothetical protein [Desulfosporosinus nitroreducens]MDO0825300.1 hypothetical protein [Desulfosporosinus nitroreducens]